MECACGIAYPDTRLIWKHVGINDNVSNSSLFYAVCPECLEIGIKINRECRYSDENETSDYFTENLRNATRIHPQLRTPERREIALDGVPENDCSDYRKALIALDHPDLYEFANILARRSLESTLRTQYEGRTLSNLIDALLQDKESGLSHRLLKNIDGIRNLGNIGAHETSDPNQATLRADKEQTSWNVTVWERLLEEWYVRPTQDAAQVSRLQDAGLKVRQPKG